MSLSQVQIIQSLAEALSWFEKELAWGVDPAELRHLTGRVGELYAAMITRGQLALATNQRGYDVVSGNGEHISVKTITSSNHVSFRKSTFAEADRIIVLRINVDEGEASIEELVDLSSCEMVAQCQEGTGDYRYAIRAKPVLRRPDGGLAVTPEATTGSYRIAQYESGTVAVWNGDVLEPVAKPVLRRLAAEHGVDLLNGAGNARNTRQLGAALIAALRPSYQTEKMGSR